MGRIVAASTQDADSFGSIPPGTQRPPGQDTVHRCYYEDDFKEYDNESDFESTDDDEDDKDNTRGLTCPSRMRTA